VPERVQDSLISILMLSYNHERFAAEAMAGVLSQTYSPLEIIIIDDCSTDGTAKVIKAALAKHPHGSRATFAHNSSNLGPFGAARVGLGMAKGDFIVLASGDDIMLPNMVADMAKVWMAEEVSLVTANADYIDENSQALGRTHRDPNGTADDNFETLVRDGANACCFGAGIGFERESYSTFGWPPDYLGAADIMLPFWAYCLKGARFISKPLLKYRVHAHNTSLSLLAEKSDKLNELVTYERMFYLHLAHALFMQDELTRLGERKPDRYAELAPRISPLVSIQIVEMARKLVRARVELDEFRRRAANPG